MAWYGWLFFGAIPIAYWLGDRCGLYLMLGVVIFISIATLGQSDCGTDWEGRGITYCD